MCPYNFVIPFTVLLLLSSCAGNNSEDNKQPINAPNNSEQINNTISSTPDNSDDNYHYVSHEELLAESKNEQEEAFLNSQIKLKSNNPLAKEFPSEKSEELLNELYSDFEKFDYQLGISKVDKVLNSFNLTKGKNLEIASLYSDFKSILASENATREEKEDILMNWYKNPKSFLYAYVKADYQTKNYLCLDVNSNYVEEYAPISINAEKIFKDVKEIEDYNVKPFLEQLGNVRSIYRYHFNLQDGTGFYTYIYETYEGRYGVIGIYAEDGIESYLQVFEMQGYGGY